MSAYSRRLHGMLLTGLGVLVLTPDSLLIRLIEADPLTLLFWRGLLLSLSLGIFFAVRYNRTVLRQFWTIGIHGLFVVLLFASGTILFVTSIIMTAVANTLVIISAAPLLAAIFSHLFLHEDVPLRTWLATFACMVGIASIFAGSLGRGAPLGDFCAAGTACALAGNLVIIRHARSVSMVPALALSGIVVAIAVIPFASPFAVSTRDLVLLLLLGAVVLPISIGLITVGPRYLPAPEVALLMLLETVLGPLWVWLAMKEVPTVETFLGGTLVITTLAIHSALGLRSLRNK